MFIPKRRQNTLSLTTEIPTKFCSANKTGCTRFHIWAFDWHQDRWPWMTSNCCKVEFSRNFTWFRVWEAITAKRMQIEPYCQQWKCSPVNVVSSNIRVMQIFTGVWKIWGVKQESGRLRCRFSYLSLAIFSESSSLRHDKLTQCCRAFTLALARLSCIISFQLSSTHKMFLSYHMSTTYI